MKVKWVKQTSYGIGHLSFFVPMSLLSAFYPHYNMKKSDSLQLHPVSNTVPRT